ncbi:MAG: putative 2OG-Fe(II) oxygenase [Pseudolabrys sp.]
MSTLLSFARAAVEQRPDKPLLKAQLGTLLWRTGEFSSAIEALEDAAAHDPAGFRNWGPLADSYLELGRFTDVLAIARRLQDREPIASVETARGIALQKLGQFKESRAALTRAISLGPQNLDPHRALLRMIVQRADGAELLDACDAMPAAVQNLALVTGHRALAFSMLGRADAGSLVDIYKQVMRVRFEPPAEFGGIERFNRTLADEILSDADARPPDRSRDINYKDDLFRTPAKQALHDFVRDAVDSYIREMPRLGTLPPPPPSGLLRGAHVVLRHSGRNGQHLHPPGYVSTIYYVSVPALDPDSNRGALILGCCDQYAKGHAAIWGLRHIKPEPGVLLIFPSHIFHDVMPTGSSEPRISVVADLIPPEA